VHDPILWNIQPDVEGFPLQYPVVEMEGEEIEVELVEEFNPQPEISGFNNPGGYLPRR
jgi:hypothetical protein